ncbi:uncharacterized protein LOC135153701 [Lytechinus pictus]|uniref:uncharacterized protein LOC135153701 n=1 Tax=Lytechinus pictus TaxID=7653 RepID=UPI0030B9CD6B
METRNKVKNNSAKATGKAQTLTNDTPKETNRDQQGVESSHSLPHTSRSSGAQPCTTERKDTTEDKERLFGDDLQRRIEDALQSKEVISSIVKAVSDAILEDVKNEVYKAIDFDMQEKTNKIADLDHQLHNVKAQISSFRDVMEEQEQYSRRNCLRFHGINESANEVTDDIVIKVVREKLQINIQPSDIDHSHRIPLRAKGPANVNDHKDVVNKELTARKKRTEPQSTPSLSSLHDTMPETQCTKRDQNSKDQMFTSMKT